LTIVYSVLVPRLVCGIAVISLAAVVVAPVVISVTIVLVVSATSAILVVAVMLFLRDQHLWRRDGNRESKSNDPNRWYC
jgi:hypothetical protein